MTDWSPCAIPSSAHRRGAADELDADRQPEPAQDRGDGDAGVV